MLGLNFLRAYFRFEALQTGFRQELLAGFTTFLTMAYVVVVNPRILESAGLPLEAAMAATVYTAFVGTLLMGVYARRPFAIAPYMGENAFIAVVVVQGLGYSWQVALGGIFLSGVIFAVLTLLHVRTWLVHAIPEDLKIAISIGIGLFLTFIGLNASGLIQVGTPEAPLHVGNLHEPTVILGLVGILFTGALTLRRVPGALFWGILATTLFAGMTGLLHLPPSWISAPPDLSKTLGQLDIVGALQPGFWPLILVILMLIFVDTTGTLLGLADKANLLDDRGQLPEIEKPMLCDAVATMAAAVFGSTTAGAYLESAAGIEAGGRSGLTAVVTALLFLGTLFLAPGLTMVPPYAYGPALVLVGLLMLTPMTRLNLTDPSTALPALAVIVVTCFTYNLGMGITAGFLLYPAAKLVVGQGRDIPAGLWVLAAFALLFFLSYPYTP